MFGLGTTELIIIGVIIFVIFGAKRLPDIGKGLGGALKEFRQIKKEIKPEVAAGNDGGEENEKMNNDPLSIESKVAEKVMQQIPGVKKVIDAKAKIEKVKEIIK